MVREGVLVDSSECANRCRLYTQIKFDLIN